MNDLKDKSGIIYRIFNIVNNKSYIGKSSKTFNDRYPGGKWWLSTSNQLLKKELRSFTPNFFKVEILEYGLSTEELSFIEMLYIFSLKTTFPNGYNIAYDDNPLNSSDGNLWLPEFVAEKMYGKLKNGNRKGRKCSDVTKYKISQSNIGKKRSDESRKLMSEVRKGKRLSKDHIEKIRTSLTGRAGRAVVQLSLDGAIIAEYSSAENAALAVKITSSGITSVCAGRQKTCAGFKWKYKL